MFSNAFYRRSKISPDGFRYRGTEGSRLEQLTDGVFAFSITLLVISSQVPRTYIELQASMYSFIGFIFCIILLLGIWNHHRNFFLYYGLEDNKVKTLTFFLYFILLFYIYPLKFLFSYIGTALYVRFKMTTGDQSEALQLALENLGQSDMNALQWQDIMIRFGLGLFAIYLIFLLLHTHVLKRKDLLELDEFEVYQTKTFMQAFGLLMGVTVLSMLIVLLFGGTAAGYAGGAYFLVALVIPWHRRYRKKNSPYSEFSTAKAK